MGRALAALGINAEWMDRWSVKKRTERHTPETIRTVALEGWLEEGLGTLITRTLRDTVACTGKDHNGETAEVVDDMAKEMRTLEQTHVVPGDEGSHSRCAPGGCGPEWTRQCGLLLGNLLPNRGTG